jgi:hypothetical protein
VKRNKLNVFAVIFLAGCVAFSLGSDTVFAYDDFGRMVHHIESTYHAHRSYRFIMGFAGLAVKCWHVGGVKNFKAAIFENQNFINTDRDSKIDDIARHAIDEGWQPVVQSFSRRSGEHTYVLTRPDGRDLKFLILNLERTEANVIQVKVDPKKLDQFMEENVVNHHHQRERPREVDDAIMSFR